eukprot:TRINITY_DN685_c0_g1_i2.p1 TRINITY_DN685_c0_g1~~TRINITY_DN685_c0_g1_i2.p1  ORF type:complete len:176 (-),score=25.28 TRINITY_DN685_c0_g1_i2:381-908(-)
MGHREHGHQTTSHYGHSEPSPAGDLVKIHTEADAHYLLSAKGDTVVLTKSNDRDSEQEWYKDDTHGTKVKDDEGHPAFLLINKASRLALKHVSGHNEDTVTLGPYHEGNVDHSLLWTLSKDVGGGYKSIRPVGDTKLNLDADHADKEHGGPKEHNRIILFKWNKQANQKWKIISA